MPESTNTSFIPKRNPIKTKRRSTPRPVFIGTLVIRVLFFAILISALAVFAYERKLNSDYDKEVLALNSAIESFSEVDMQKVLDIDNRLYQTQNRLAHTASVATIFSALENATLQSVKIDSLSLERVSDNLIKVESVMKTDTFDSVIFQRRVLQGDEKLSVSNLRDLTIGQEVPAGSVGSNNNVDTETILNFSADIEIDTKIIPHLPVFSADLPAFETTPVVESTEDDRSDVTTGEPDTDVLGEEEVTTNQDSL